MQDEWRERYTNIHKITSYLLTNSINKGTSDTLKGKELSLKTDKSSNKGTNVTE